MKLKRKFNTTPIIDFLEREKLSVKEFCKKYDIKKSDFKKIFHDDFSVGSEEVMKIAEIIDVNPAVLFPKK